MRVLVACEYSGRVREAFRAKGHEAYSCDLLPSEDDSPYHWCLDVLDLLDQDWDLMIAHPPCTYLTNSANKWFKDQSPRKSGALVGAERRAARKKAIEFFMKLYNAPIPKIAIENPIGVMNRLLFKPQTVQPWMFGHGETKATCFWLKGLSNLIPTDVVEGREQRLHRLSPSKDRWKERSRTFQGIANAMAEQWG